MAEEHLAYVDGLRVQLARDVREFEKTFYTGRVYRLRWPWPMTSRDADWHTDAPVGGFALDVELVLVVDGDQLVPYAAWAAKHDVRVVCPLCRSSIFGTRQCPALPSPGPSCDLTETGDPVRRSRR